ncbi:unnamed protein product [Calicophoron daubneyi]|uniref:Uncharacterized protein n=1 Tax=Calicophoron daubneyi TaxID=300641 RepID=A0AAV2TUY2_CALDB
MYHPRQALDEENYTLKSQEGACQKWTEVLTDNVKLQNVFPIITYKDNTDEQISISDRMQRNYNYPADEEQAPLAQMSSPEEQQLTEVTRSSNIEGSMRDPAPAPYIPPSSERRRSSIPESRTPHEQASSHISNGEESYAIPHHSSSSSAPRMIQQGTNGQPTTQNAFRRLRSMGSIGEPQEKLPALPPPGDLGLYGYPGTKSDAKKPPRKYPKSSEYKLTRCFCYLTTLVTVIISIASLGMIGFAVYKVIKEEKCYAVAFPVIITSAFALLIITLEWTRLWLWREPSVMRKCSKSRASGARAYANKGSGVSGGSLPPIFANPQPMPSAATFSIAPSGNDPCGGFLSSSFQQRLYDAPQFVSALFLIFLYLTLIIGVGATMGGAGYLLSQEEKCGDLAIPGVGYGAFLAVLIVVRTMMCCLSNACHGLCYRTATMFSKPENEPVQMVAINQLNQVLPGLGSGGDAHPEGRRPTAWLLNLATGSDPRQQLSIIQPMPARFSNDLP